MEMEISRLQFDECLWPRIQRDDDRVAHLVDVLTAGGRLPAVKVQHGTNMVLGGWHTAAAYERLHRETVPVEIVDIPEPERLLYAYREDACAALPYTAADVRSVARRLYQQRSNGQGANVAELARDLGRAQPTVTRWVSDLVAADNVRDDLSRQGRALALRALCGSGCTQRRAAEIVGVDESTVRRDIQLNITPHGDVLWAHEHLVLAMQRGATTEEVRAAREWLLGQSDPHQQAMNRVRQDQLYPVLDAYRAAAELLKMVPAARTFFDTPGLDDPELRPIREQLLNAITEIYSLTREYAHAAEDFERRHL